MPLYIGVDLGTSSVKVGAYSETGEQRALVSRDYAMMVDEPGKSELNPNEVVAAALDALRECVSILPEKPRALGFSTQLHSLMAIENGAPITNLYTWADKRGEAARETILDTMDVMGVFNRTAGRIEHPVFWPAKLTWLHQTRPDLFRSGVRFISIKCYLFYRLSDEYVMDWSDASATGIFNIFDYCWDEPTVEAIPGLTMDHLVSTRDCASRLHGLNPMIAASLSLDASIPLILGAGDGMMAHLGCGALEPGMLSSTVGTSGAIRAMSAVPVLDPKRRTFCFCLQKGFYVAGGAVNNGGIVMSYLKDLFRDQWDADARRLGEDGFYRLIDRMAAEVPPGSDGVMFLPFLAGERAPHYNAKATAVLYGLTLSHDRRHILRAAFEGVMYQLNAVYRALEAVTGPATAILANGGYTYSDFWLQVQADVFCAPVRVSGIEQASALGAAYLAMFGVGDIPSIRHPLPVMRESRVVSPALEDSAAYRGYAEAYYRLYERVFS